MVLNKYDVLVSLKPGTDIVRWAGIWDTVGKITMHSVMHSTRIFGDAKTVALPKVLVNYPPRDYVTKSQHVHESIWLRPRYPIGKAWNGHVYVCVY